MLYPNRIQIRNGTFVRARLSKWMDRSGGRATVVAPVPWFPLDHSRFGRRPDLAEIPTVEADGGIDVHHPRFLSLPILGRVTNPWTYYRKLRAVCSRLDMEGVDAIDAHFAFPDGVAATLLGRALGIPVVVTVRGSDLNVMLEHAFVRAWVRWALRRCSAVIAVSEPLSRRARELCGEDTPVSVIRNGVDVERFRILPERAEPSAASGAGAHILSVGNLIELKGHHLVVEAVAEIPNARLTIIGRGDYQSTLSRLIEEKGLSERVTIVGEMSQDELVSFYNRADVLVLASRNEGTPNVVLESLACGTPVVATAVGGIPDVLTSDRQGRLVTERSAAALRSAIRDLLADDAVTPAAVRASVGNFSWDETADRVEAVFESVVRESRSASGAQTADVGS